jgi:hypothetical protein
MDCFSRLLKLFSISIESLCPLKQDKASYMMR